MKERILAMNSAEIKLDIFRKIDKLSQSELESFYDKFLSIISLSTTYNLNKNERQAIEDAFKESEKSITSADVLNEAKSKYSNLRFE